MLTKSGLKTWTLQLTCVGEKRLRKDPLTLVRWFVIDCSAITWVAILDYFTFSKSLPQPNKGIQLSVEHSIVSCGSFNYGLYSSGIRCYC